VLIANPGDMEFFIAMRQLEALLDSVLMEGRFRTQTMGAMHRNFLSAGHRIMRLAERSYGMRCVTPLMERLRDRATDGPAAIVMLGSLLRLVPTRQTWFERILGELLPSWETALQGNPQDALPPEFQVAALRARKKRLRFPKGFVDALAKVAQSRQPDVATAGLKALTLAGPEEGIALIREIMGAAPQAVQSSVTLCAARLSAMDEDLNQELAEQAFERGRTIEERLAAFEALTVGGKSAGPGSAVLEAIANTPFVLEPKELPLLDAILDAPGPQMRSLSEAALRGVDLAALPNSTLRRLSRVQNLPAAIRTRLSRRNGVSSAEKAVVQRRKARSVAELSEAVRSRVGLVAHRNSSAAAGWIGHVGVFVAEDTMIHCTTGHDPHAVRRITFADWKAGLECWGIREDHLHPVNLAAVVNRALEIASWRTEYDGAHNNQKGKWFKGWFCAPKYWEADCVGFAEHCYEHSGGNPTPNEYESGAGWPLTPREQRDHMRKVFDC
jgi:hypothetical protein